VRLEDREQPALDLLERLVPADLHELPVPLHERAADPVRVLVELLERGALRADVALAEDVVLVAADAGDLLPFGTVLQRDLETAPGLAQRARAERRARHLATPSGNSPPAS
jgi:hypothetical protein